MLNAFSMVGAVSGGILFGLLSDRIGRRRAMVIALVLACCVVPMWAFARNAALLWAGGFLIQFMVQGAWGIIPAHISELSPDSVRGFLPGFAYQCGVLIAGTAPLLQTYLAEKTGNYAPVMAGTALIVFSLAAIVTALGKERHGAAFGVIAET
jgi:SHS family lactate transporter-like MFS transporter